LIGLLGFKFFFKEGKKKVIWSIYFFKLNIWKTFVFVSFSYWPSIVFCLCLFIGFFFDTSIQFQ
jgi:hypothetical protein